MQVSISGQALVFVVRTQRWSLMDRAGTAIYIAFACAQVGCAACCTLVILPRHLLGCIQRHGCCPCCNRGRCLRRRRTRCWQQSCSQLTLQLPSVSLWPKAELRMHLAAEPGPGCSRICHTLEAAQA